MNTILSLKEILLKNIFFIDFVKNTVMNDSSFIRIIYSNKDLILNGLYIKINLYNYIKTTQKDISLYISELIDNIDKLEKDILNKYNINKIQVNKLKDQLLYYIHKINTNTQETTVSYLLKISGIWETNNNIGLTYKFIYLPNSNLTSHQ